MLLTVRSTAMYELSADAYMCLMVEPPLVGSTHRVEDERLFTSPTSFCELSRDLYGNPLRRLIAAKGVFNFDFTATIEAAGCEYLSANAIEQPPQHLPPEAMIYTLPSRYCESDLLARMAQLEFGHLPYGGRGSKRSRSGSGSMLNIATGQPTRGRRHSIRRPNELASAATLPIWLSHFAGDWTSRPAMSRAMHWGSTARLPWICPGLPGRNLA